MTQKNTFDPTRQPPPGGGGSGSEPPSPFAGTTRGTKPANVDETRAAAILARRRWLGYGCMLSGAVGMLGLGFFSLHSLHDLVPSGLASVASDTVIVASLTAHAIVSIALVVFFYQVIRVGERMVFPHWLATSSEDAELARVFLANEHPARAAVRILREMRSVVNVPGADVRLSIGGEDKGQ